MCRALAWSDVKAFIEATSPDLHDSLVRFRFFTALQGIMTAHDLVCHAKSELSPIALCAFVA